MSRLKLLKGILKNYRGLPTPLVLAHQITQRCNLKCIFCPFWRRPAKGEELSTDEIKSAVSQAAELGVAIYSIWGGEPLLRDDMGECLAQGKKLKMKTYIITNGTLKEKIREIAPYLDYITVSIDGLRETYRELRGHDHFDDVIETIKISRDNGLKVAINCVINEKNINELEELVFLAEELNSGISFEPIHRYDEIPEAIWSELEIKNNKKYERAVDNLICLKKEGRKIMNSLTYLKMIKNLEPDFKCHIHKIILHLDAYGNLETCFGNLGNVRTKTMRDIWFSQEAKSSRKKMKSCHGCLFSGYVEGSLLYSLNPEVIINSIGLIK